MCSTLWSQVAPVLVSSCLACHEGLVIGLRGSSQHVSCSETGLHLLLTANQELLILSLVRALALSKSLSTCMGDRGSI